MAARVFLPRDAILGGHIFYCSNHTMPECFARMLFDSVRAIRPGVNLFLYNYQTGYLHGIFEATSFGGTNLEPEALQDCNDPGRSRSPAQIRVRWKMQHTPLPEAIFAPFLEHLPNSNRFRIEPTVPETLSIMDAFDLHG